MDNIGENEKLLRASKDFQKLGEGKKRRRLLREAQRKDGTYIAPKSSKEYERITEEERIREEEIRKRLIELEKAPHFERPEGRSDEEYTRELIKIQAETDGIRKGEKLINKEFSKFSISTTDPIKLQEQINRLRNKPSTNKEHEIKKGPRGGRYTEDKTKDGRPYRRYF